MEPYIFNCQRTVDNFPTFTQEVFGSYEFNNFGHFYNDSQTFLQHIPALFNIARQKWARMESHCYSKSLCHNKSQNWWIFRKEIIDFLINLKTLLNKLYSQAHNFNSLVIKQSLKDFYHSLGSLSKLHWNRALYFCSTLDYKDNLLYNFLHLNLEVRWIIITIIWTMEERADSLYPLPPLDKILNDILSDATVTAFATFSNLNVNLNDYERTTPFSCSCLKRYWLLIASLIESRNKNRQSDYFWFLLRGIFRGINNRELELIQQVASPKLIDVNELGFCWWFLLHITLLLQSERSDELTLSVLSCHHLKPVKLSSNHYELSSLLKLTFNSEIGGYSELHLRSYLRCCVKLVYMWEPVMDPSSLLWNYFKKRLSESFALSEEISMSFANGNSGLLFKTAIEDIISQNKEASTCLNSFQLFLKILSHFLNNMWSKDSGKQQIRDLIQFPPSLIQTINKVGLYNCCSLILTLGLSGDLDNAINLLTNSLSKFFPCSLDAGKNAILWKCYFGLIFICVERNLPIDRLAKKMVENVNELQRELKKFSKNPPSVQWSTDLLTIYHESVQDLFNISLNFPFSFHILLKIDFEALHSRSPESLVQLSIKTIDVVVNKLQQCQTEEISLTFLRHLLPWVKKLAALDSAFSISALSRAAIGSVILRQYTLTSSIENTKSLIHYFCFNHTLHNEFRCQFFMDLVKESSLLFKIENEFVDIQLQIIRTWFYLILIRNPSLQFEQFSKAILNLSEIKLMASEANVALAADCLQSGDVIDQLLNIFASYGNQNNFHVSRLKICAYLSEIPKVIPIVLKNNNKDEVERLYNFIGKIFQKLSPLIYVKSDPKCLQYEFLNLLLLPSAFYNVKFFIPENTLGALRKNLSLFIEGLCNLDFINDMYINRNLKNIFKLYLWRFSEANIFFLMNRGCDMPHPLVVSFLNVKKIISGFSGFTKLVIEIIRDSYLLTNNRQVHFNLDTAVRFLLEILQHCSFADRSFTCPMLLTQLLKLTCITDLKYSSVINLVKLLVDGYTEVNKSADALSQSLTIIIEEYFAEYQTIPENLFKVLGSLASLYPRTVNQLHPLLGEKISLRERNICGTDESLRRNYKDFLFLSNKCHK